MINRVMMYEVSCLWQRATLILCLPSLRTFALKIVNFRVAIKIKNFRIRKGYAEMSKTGQNILFFNLFTEIFLKEKRKKIS